MKSPLHILSFCFLISLLAQAQITSAQCCRPPDSLKVKGTSDSSFCVQFNSRSLDSTADSLVCDTAKTFEIQWKRLGDSLHPWNDAVKKYNGKFTYTFCDTASPCTKYQWRVRNLCIKNGDTTKSVWVSGPRITTVCDSGHLTHNQQIQNVSKLHVVKISPNPAHDKIAITGNFNGIVQISISNVRGQQVRTTISTVTNSKLLAMISLSNLDNGIYFVTISDKTDSTKLTFVKE